MIKIECFFYLKSFTICVNQKGRTLFIMAKRKTQGMPWYILCNLCPPGICYGILPAYLFRSLFRIPLRSTFFIYNLRVNKRHYKGYSKYCKVQNRWQLHNGYNKKQYGRTYHNRTGNTMSLIPYNRICQGMWCTYAIYNISSDLWQIISDYKKYK